MHKDVNIAAQTRTEIVPLQPRLVPYGVVQIFYKPVGAIINRPFEQG